MNPRQLLDRLAATFPEFRHHWDDPDNCFRDDDGSFTFHGVFAEFTSFFRDRYKTFTPDQVATLGKFLSDCMAPDDDSALDNAAATCFVENIAGDECDRELSKHLTGPARRYWREWGGRAIPAPRREQ